MAELIYTRNRLCRISRLIGIDCLEVRSLDELWSKTHIPRILLSAFDGLYNVLTEGGHVIGGFNASKIYFCAGGIMNTYARF